MLGTINDGYTYFYIMVCRLLHTMSLHNYFQSILDVQRSDLKRQRHFSVTRSAIASHLPWPLSFGTFVPPSLLF
jgi:hypothetical protein